MTKKILPVVIPTAKLIKYLPIQYTWILKINRS